MMTGLSGSTRPVETVHLPISAGAGQQIALHCVTPATATHKAVLFIHGSVFPTMLAAGFEFAPGDSWMEFMAKQGFLSCGLDFLGFGASSRPPAMFRAPEGNAPLVRAPEAAREIAVAIGYLRTTRGIREMHVIAHSWGTIPAATFAAGHPKELASLTLFGPVVPVSGSKPVSEHSAWWSMTATERLEQLYFKKALPRGLVLLEPVLAQKWAEEFTASAPHMDGDAPGEIRIPAGPDVDIEAAQAGIYPYSPERLTIPVFAVYGSHDVVTDDLSAAAFLKKLTASPLKWRLRIDQGTHVLHLERNRRSLYASVLAFINASEAVRPEAEHQWKTSGRATHDNPLSQ